MKIILISDTHGKHHELTADLDKLMTDYENTMIIHAGDVTDTGKPHQILDFLNWFSRLNCHHKVFVAGNHDFGFEKNNDIAPEFKEMGVTYLMDNMVELEGIKIYGSPWQPRFYDWAFNVDRGDAIAKKWKNIPEGLDVLVTHGPVHGILDDTYFGQRVGCEELQKKIWEIKPMMHVCGHIHYARGYKPFNGINFFNASVLGENYMYINKPIVVILDDEKDIVDIEIE